MDGTGRRQFVTFIFLLVFVSIYILFALSCFLFILKQRDNPWHSCRIFFMHVINCVLRDFIYTIPVNTSRGMDFNTKYGTRTLMPDQITTEAICGIVVHKNK